MERPLSMKIWIILIVGVIVTVTGVTVGVMWYSIYDWIVTKELTLSPTSTNYNMWKETPIPMYLKIYFFNWTNAADFNKTDDKPNFVELGPYTFKQVDYKVNKVWNNNGTVTYQRRRIWHFDESLSNGKLSDEITNLNPVATTVAYSLRYKSEFLRDMADRVMKSVGEEVIITRTVGELLFDGYNNTLLTIARKLKISTIPFNKFGWFYGRNGSDTYDGTYNMLTGEDNLYDLGIIKEWNYSNRSKYYDGDCSIIDGTNGDLWPPLPDNRSVSIFISDVCTSLKLTYDNTSSFQGLTGVKYISDETMLDNGTHILARRCYCPYKQCIPSGLLDVSRCKYNAPAFVSAPHFYLADPVYKNAISGMEPSKEKHEMLLIVEPTTGVPMRVRAKLQLNLLLQPDKYMSLFKGLKKTYVPMFWFVQEADLTTSYASKVKFLLILPSLGSVTSFGVAGIGILIFFIGIFVWIRRSWRGEENQVLISKNDTSTLREE